jgi:hypothetical protein
VRRVSPRAELSHARRSRRPAAAPPPRAHYLRRAGAAIRTVAAARGRIPNAARNAGETATPKVIAPRPRSCDVKGAVAPRPASGVGRCSCSFPATAAVPLSPPLCSGSGHPTGDLTHRSRCGPERPSAGPDRLRVRP